MPLPPNPTPTTGEGSAPLPSWRWDNNMGFAGTGAQVNPDPLWGGCGRCGEHSNSRCATCSRCYNGCCTCTVCPGNGSHDVSHGMRRPARIHTCGRCGDHCACARCTGCSRQYEGDRRLRCERCGYCTTTQVAEAGSPAAPQVCCGCPRAGETTSLSFTDDLGPHDTRPVAFMRARTFQVNPLRRFMSVELEIGRDKGNADAHVLPVLRKYDMTAKEDGSVYSGCEITTQPSNGDEFITQIRELSTALSTVGAQVDATCGLHVHVDARDYTWENMRRMLLVWSRIESAMFLSVPPARRQSRFAQGRDRRIRMWFPEAGETIPHLQLKDRIVGLIQGLSPNASGRRQTDEQVVARFMLLHPAECEIPLAPNPTGGECNCQTCRTGRLPWPRRIEILDGERSRERAQPRFATVANRELVEHYLRPTRAGAPGVFLDGHVDRNWRYYALNLLSWFSHGTIEFRCHSGTTNFTKITNWALLWGNFIEKCRTITDEEVVRIVDDQNRDSWQVLLDDIAPNDEIRTWLVARRELFEKRALKGEHVYDDETLPITPARRRAPNR